LLALVLGSSPSAQRLTLGCPPAPLHILSALANVSNACSERILKLQHTKTSHHTSRHPPGHLLPSRPHPSHDTCLETACHFIRASGALQSHIHPLQRIKTLDSRMRGHFLNNINIMNFLVEWSSSPCVGTCNSKIERLYKLGLHRLRPRIERDDASAAVDEGHDRANHPDIEFLTFVE
jgi:hypothetical protein